MVPGSFKTMDFPFPYSGGLGPVRTTILWQVLKSPNKNRSFKWDSTLCRKYLSVPAIVAIPLGLMGSEAAFCKNDCYKLRVDPKVV